MSEGVKYPKVHQALLDDSEMPGLGNEEMHDLLSVEEAYAAIEPVIAAELAAAERTALDYARIDALRLAAEKEVDVLAGELEVARKRIAALEATMNRAQLFDVDATLDRGQS